ncbi:unnamed protein product [Clonostachys solani]|uniref:Phenylacetyl-CoA ligase n=1 Tax=Clonostachys solani TaxID=160281 RepID=A0A9P0EPG6_9HYPO|nr:unnamed protein product [Clonostachys solani]
MVFHPPAWVPQLPEIPDSITVGEFLSNERHGRYNLDLSRSPYTCGLTGKTYTARDVVDRTECIARSLARRLRFDPHDGTEWDRVVCLFSLNTIDYIPLTHAIHRLNGIVTPASAASSVAELQQQLRSSRASAIFTSIPLLGTALEAARAVKIPEEAIFILPLPPSETREVQVTGVVPPSIDDLVAEGRTLPAVKPLSWTKGQGARQVAYLCYSSGTSGLPKAVKISHFNIIANILQIAAFEGSTRKQRGVKTQVNLGVLPLGHIYGLTVIALASQYRGDEVIILPRFNLGTFLDSVEKFKIERLYLVPPIIIQMMNNEEACRRRDLTSVRSVYSGAAPLGAELIRSYLKRYPEVAITQSYGLTEASPMVVITSEVDGLVGSSGSVIPGTKIKLVDVKGKEVTSHETRGELLVQSPSVVLGYFENEKATAETFVWDDDGRWLKTGDEVLVRKSSLGHEHLVVVDRIKELIKVKGHQVAPAELEAHLMAHPFVSDCAVIPVPHPRADEVPKAFVVKSNEAPLDDKETALTLSQHVKEHKARYKWLTGGVAFLDVIPKSPSGKILRRTLKDQEKQRLSSIKAKI